METVHALTVIGDGRVVKELAAGTILEPRQQDAELEGMVDVQAGNETYLMFEWDLHFKTEPVDEPK